jgi:glycosyltransferase involved in cell wall biosynthesis
MTSPFTLRPTPEFTVFTATYNRGHTLHRVHDSLKAQSFRDFEWLIVDDGSSDNTRERVAEWQNAAEFPIRYVYQDNQGKPAAFNHGVDLAGGEFFLSVDSDDGFLPHALQTFHDIWHAIPDRERWQFTGVTALCIDEHGVPVSRPLVRDIVDCTSIESRYLYKARGDKWGFHRTRLLRRFPFPILPGCTFIPESCVWDRIARAGYKTRYVNRPLHVYYVPNNSAGTNLSLNRNLGLSNPEAYVLWSKDVLENDLKWIYLRRDPMAFVRMALRFVRYGLHTPTPLWTRLRGLANTRAKLAVLLALLPGWLAYQRDQWRQAGRGFLGLRSGQAAQG